MKKFLIFRALIILTFFQSALASAQDFNIIYTPPVGSRPASINANPATETIEQKPVTEKKSTPAKTKQTKNKHSSKEKKSTKNQKSPNQDDRGFFQKLFGETKED